MACDDMRGVYPDVVAGPLHRDEDLNASWKSSVCRQATGGLIAQPSMSGAGGLDSRLRLLGASIRFDTDPDPPQPTEPIQLFNGMSQHTMVAGAEVVLRIMLRSEPGEDANSLLALLINKRRL